MKEIQKGSLEKAAIKVGISKKTARKYAAQKQLPIPKTKRTHRTRVNPFEEAEGVIALDISPDPAVPDRVSVLFEGVPERDKTVDGVLDRASDGR